MNVTSLDFAITIDDYLDQAIGFQSAYSFASCNPPRSIVFCTTSIIQYTKCSWLQEVSSVYGVEPNIQCIRAEHLERCMDDTKHNAADVVLVDQDDRVQAEREFNLKPILFEYSQTVENQYAVLAVVKSKSNIKHFKDLIGKKACFPKYEGIAYLSVMETIRNLSLVTNDCHYSSEINDFFSSTSCTWGPNRKCDKSYYGEEGALKCLADGGDVAFVSAEVFNNFASGNIINEWSLKLRKINLEVLCPFGKSKSRSHSYCYLHWAPGGFVMIHNETTLMRQNEIYNSLRDMDKLFGKPQNSLAKPFTMYGPFDKRNNIIFRDTTDRLVGYNDLKKEKYGRNLEHAFLNYMTRTCQSRSRALLLLPVSQFYLVLFVTISFSLRKIFNSFVL